MQKRTYFYRGGSSSRSIIKKMAAPLAAIALLISASVIQLAQAADSYSWQQLPVSTNGAAATISGMSSDGNVMYVVAEDRFMYSGDNGVTWTDRTHPVTASVFQLGVSANGLKLVAVNNSNAFVSNDGAQTWSAAIPIGCNINALDMSDDGTTLIGGCSNGFLYTSVNGGLNWTQRTGAGSHRWYAVSVTADGSKMAAVESDATTSTPGALYTSTDGGVTWTAQAGAGTRHWRSVDISADGTRLVASAVQATTTGAPSDIYRSTDGGVTWTTQTGLGQVVDSGSGIVISRDGQTVVASDRQSDDPVVKVSTDGGGTWAHTERFDFYYFIQNAAVSSDGTTILVSNVQGPVVLSRDEGATWSIISDIRSFEVAWTDVAMTIDGQKMWLTNWYPSGALQQSDDGGDTWQDLDSIGSHDLDGVDVSSDGTYITATGGCSWAETFLHVSSDGGQTWSEKVTDMTRPWDQVAMSADGRVQIASVCHENLYVSTDYGQTWTVRMNDMMRDWTDVAVSADGTRIVAATYRDGMFYSSDSGQTWTQSMDAGARDYYHMAMSASGKTVIVGTNASANDYVYRSDDYGVTWQAISALGAKKWQGLAISADGTKMAVSTRGAVTNPGVYVSSDNGASWELQSAPADYYELTMSADGSVILASAWANVRRAVSSAPPVAPPVPSGGIIAGSGVIEGEGTPGSTMLVTLPGGNQISSQVSVTGQFTADVPDGTTLQVGDVVTLQQRSIAGVLGTSTDATVTAADMTLADTGTNVWLLVMTGLGIVVATTLSYRRLSARRISF